MGAKVSISSSTAARAASTQSSDSPAAREPSGASSPNRFSSLMDAASQPVAPSEQKSSGGARNSSSGATTATTEGQSAGPARAPDKGQDPKSGAATDAGAASARAAVSIVDGEAADQQAESLDKDKLRREDLATLGTSLADPSALALLLSSPGSAVDGNNTTGAKSNSGSDSKGADEDASVQNAAAAGALALGLTLGPAAAGLMPVAKTDDAARHSDSGAIGSATTADARPASASSDLSLIKFEALSAGVAPDDGSSPPDLSTLKSSSPDSQSPQRAALAGSAGSTDIVRSLSTASAQSTAIERTINLPVGDRNWSGAVAGHVQWMVSNNIQSATLQLSPEHLGPVEVRIDMHQSQVNVSFSADHPDTRIALEQSVPKLREIFAGGGLTLGQATVQQESRSGSQFAQPGARASLVASRNADSVALPSIRALGLVDEYA